MFRSDVSGCAKYSFHTQLAHHIHSREVGHRVKSLTASTFSGPETVALQNGGNAVAQSIWLGHYKGTAPEPESDSDVRWFMRQKYYESKWCDQKLLKSHMEKVQNEIKELFNAVSR
jgi:hypothetical protein